MSLSLPNSSNPLNPLSFRDNVSALHTIPCGHLYPDSLLGLQYVSGMARSVIFTFLKLKLFKSIQFGRASFAV